MLLDEQAFRALVAEAVADALSKQSHEQYEGFADATRFMEISGISKHDLEEKLMPHPTFNQHVYRLDGRKRYIDIKPALDSIRQIMKEVK